MSVLPGSQLTLHSVPSRYFKVDDTSVKHDKHVVLSARQVSHGLSQSALNLRSFDLSSNLSPAALNVEITNDDDVYVDGFYTSAMLNSSGGVAENPVPLSILIEEAEIDVHEIPGTPPIFEQVITPVGGTISAGKSTLI